jgi:hypothetical protein
MLITSYESVSKEKNLLSFTLSIAIAVRQYRASTNIVEELTEKIRARSPLGRMSARSLSMAMSFEEEATTCSPIMYGEGDASSSMYGLSLNLSNARS